MFRPLRFASVAMTTALAGLLISSQADALVMTIDDGSGPIVITDQGPMDGNPAAIGSVGYNMMLPTTGWMYSATGVSKPIIGPAEIDLLSVMISGGAGTIVVTLEDEGFVRPNALVRLTNYIGGVTDGTLTTEAFLDPTNTVGVLGMMVSTQTFSGGAFSMTDYAGPYLTGGPFGIGVRLTISHTTVQQITSFNNNVSVSEPMTLGLFGLGIAGLGLVTRRRTPRF